MSGRKSIAVLLAVMSVGSSAWAEAGNLSNLKMVAKGAAKAEPVAGGVRLKMDDPGNWSSLKIVPANEGETVDLSKWTYLAVDVENVSPDKQSRLVMTLNSGGPERATRREFTVGIAVNPGEKRTLRMRLPHQWLYAPPTGIPGPRVLDTAKINNIQLDVQWPFEAKQAGLVDCKLTNLRGEEALTPSAEARDESKYLPFIDKYGQFIHADWPTKIHSDADLVAAHKAEQAELAKVTRPSSWNRFGGWRDGPQLKATGNFRTEKYEGKWYLVDPDGRLFFSQGLDVISAHNDGVKLAAGREKWFNFPLPADAKTQYQPTDVALELKYGTPEYSKAYFQTVEKRLLNWGMNSLGDWSRNELMWEAKTPYTLQLTDFDYKIPKLESTKRKFYDVFDAAYIKKMKNLVADAARKEPIVTKSLTDPMCIGYFIDNELDFGNRGKLVLTDDVLKCPAKQASKQELVKDLKAKYGTIDKLNSAWETKHADWDAVLNTIDIVPTTEAYKTDAKAFHEKTVDQYFRLCRDAVKSVAPNRLYLGTRFISTDAVRPVLYKASQKYCDVLTVNVYAHSVANFPSFTNSQFPDMPVMIGEFHFGVQLDRGMFSASLCNAGVNQADRALAYTRFLEGALVHPNIVGRIGSSTATSR
ncbi:MAG: beta-galactosidase [Tepidisphaeraceae bacterium]